MLDKKVLSGFAGGVLLCLLLAFAFIKSKTKEECTYLPEVQERHQVYINILAEELSFAGEKVHFRTPSTYLRYERELKNNTRKNSSTRLLLRNVRVWLPEIDRIIRKYGLPDDFKYLAVAESNLSNVVSEKQAAGFWQFTKTTAEEFGLQINDEVDERYHPLLATKAACRYFKQAYKQFGDWTSSAASYNRGIGGLQRAFEDQKVANFYDLDLNDETSRYLFKILALKDLIKHPAKYDLQLRYTQNSYIKKIRVDTTINNLITFCRKINAPYLTVKEYNPWILGNTLTLKPGQSYTILVPFNEIGIADPEKTKSEKDTIKAKEMIAVVDSTKIITNQVAENIIF